MRPCASSKKSAVARRHRRPLAPTRAKNPPSGACAVLVGVSAAMVHGSHVLTDPREVTRLLLGIPKVYNVWRCAGCGGEYGVSPRGIAYGEEKLFAPCPGKVRA